MEERILILGGIAMEQIDQAQAQRVWQRVRQGDSAPVDNTILPQLWELEGELHRLCLPLSRTSLGNHRALTQLRADHQARALKGLMLLVLGTAPAAPPQTTLRGNPEGLLRQCWQNRCQAFTLVQQAQLPSPYAPALSSLREGIRRQQWLILELLGSLG